ncbi:nipblb [Symbiodinium sp. CCMP2592]|nr:nipblb [Symbiodinium sp. CCMP2592]
MGFQRELSLLLRAWDHLGSILRMLSDVDEDAGKPLTATKRIPVLLPHEIFAELHSSSAYQFGTSMLGHQTPNAIKEFWEHLQRFAPMDIKGHPALESCDLSELVPLLVHFDGAEMYRNAEYNIWSFSSVFSSMLDVKDHVHTEIAKLMSWSFKILQEGRFPDRGYYGEELLEKSSRGKSRGLPLAGGWKACFYGFRGDQKARRECHFFTRHYNCNLLCDQCVAIKPSKNMVRGMNYKNFSANAPFLLTTISHETYLNTTSASDLSPWTAMPGWRLENTFFDWMHVVLLGVGRDAVAAAIKLMVMRGLIGWDTKRADLKMLTLWIKKEYKSRKSFSVISLTPANAGLDPWTEYPELGTIFKAAQVKILIWGISRKLQEVVKRVQDEDLVRMALAMRGLSEAQSLLDNGGLKFTGSEARKFDEMVHLHLRTWQRLAVKFEDLLIPLCNIRPKHHYLQHLARYVLRTRINIRIHQNFDSESYMGKIKRIACKCHSTSMLLRVQQRYILYLALLWDRAKRASVGGDVRAKSLEDILLLEERKPFSSSAENAKRRCLRG